MAVGVGGWAQGRTVRQNRGSRLDAHAGVAAAEAELAGLQTALRAALASSSSEIDGLLEAVNGAEDALIAARRSYSEAAGVGQQAPQPVLAPSFAKLVERRPRRAPTAPRPSFTYGSWV